MGIWREVLKELNTRRFSQDKLEYFFNYEMSRKEYKNIQKLNITKTIKEIQAKGLKLKYIKKVGYIIIGEGYLIMSDGQEQARYFLHCYAKWPFVARKKIIKFYKEEIA